ncbi:MAG: tetratricopeptide repeat protein [Reichenbachiella sp.]
MLNTLRPAFLIATILLCQNSYGLESIDSLNQILTNTNSPTQKIVVLNELGEIQKDADPISALPTYERIIALAKSIDDQPSVSNAYNQIGTIWYHEENLQKSTENYFLALNNLNEVSNNYELLCRVYNNIGWNFNKQNDQKRALHYYRTGEKYCAKCKNDTLLALTLNNYAVVLKDMKQYAEAINKLEEAIKTNRSIDNTQNELVNINNIGIIQLELGQYNSANQYFSQALEFNKKRKDFYEVANNLINLSDSYYRQQLYQQSEDSLMQGIYFARVAGSTTQKKNALELLYKVKTAKGDYKNALDYYIEYSTLEDSLFRQGQYTDLVELEANYKVAEKERSLQLSQNELLKQESLNALFITALTFSAILITVLVWFYIVKKRNEQKLLILNKKIDERNDEIEKINTNLEKIVVKRTKVIQGQNKRLREFAFINSHNIRRPLSSVMGLLNLIEDEKDHEKIKELVSLTYQTAEDMDEIIREINIKLNQEQF